MHFGLPENDKSVSGSIFVSSKEKHVSSTRSRHMDNIDRIENKPINKHKFKCHMKTSVRRFTWDYLCVKPDLACCLYLSLFAQTIFNCSTHVFNAKRVK